MQRRAYRLPRCRVRKEDGVWEACVGSGKREAGNCRPESYYKGLRVPSRGLGRFLLGTGELVAFSPGKWNVQIGF